MRAVLADDSVVSRNRLAQFLSDLGHEVVAVCATSDEAVAACQSHKPDILFMDIYMPGISGYVGAKKVLREGAAGHIVIVTSSQDDAGLGTLQALGMHVIRKPLSHEKVSSKLLEIDELRA